MPPEEHGFSHIQLKIDRNPAPAELMRDLLSIEVHDSLHLPDMFVIRLRDPQVFWTNSPMLALGNRVEIAIPGPSGPKKIFEGEITALEPSFLTAAQNGEGRSTAGPTLLARGYDLSHRLHRDRKTRSFVQHSASDIAAKVGREADLKTQTDSSRPYPYVLQSNQTDWEFLWQLARRIGFRVFVQEGVLHFCRDREKEKKEVVSLEWGINLIDFRAHLTTAEQVNEVVVRGWDPKAKREVVGRATQAARNTDIGEQQAGGEAAEQAFQSAARTVRVNRPVASQAEADDMAQAICDEIGQAFIRAEGVCAGQANLKAGLKVDLTGLGDRFSGHYFVTDAVHRYDLSGHTTRFTVSGRRANTLADLLHTPVAAPGERGVVVGIVTNNRDPDGLGRVKVRFPWLSDQDESDWARLATPMAGNERGIMFLPEVNDEVLLAFEQGDIHRPYVLGALWNGRDRLPKSSDEAVSSTGQVNQRVIKSRTGHLVILNDEDAGGGIIIQDKTGNNLIEINSQNNSLTIKAAGDIKVESKGKLSLKGTAGVEIEGSPSTVDVKGTRINLN
jgi:uncharacterized protein involved in type VI secretion and phage assembly